MKTDQIIELINGIDESDEDIKAKSIVSVLLSTIDSDGENKKEILSQSILNPEVQIYNMLDTIIVDIIFNSEMDIDLKEMWKISKEYLKMMNQYAQKEDDTKEIPALIFMFMPKNEGGHCFAQATCPKFFALTPIIPGGQCSCLRVLFDAENFDIYSSEDMDLSDIDTNAEIELQKRLFLDEKADSRREQRKEYMQELEEARKQQIK